MKTRKELLIEKWWDKNISFRERKIIEKEILRLEINEELNKLAEQIKAGEKNIGEALKNWEALNKELRNLNL